MSFWITGGALSEYDSWHPELSVASVMLLSARLDNNIKYDMDYKYYIKDQHLIIESRGYIPSFLGKIMRMDVRLFMQTVTDDIYRDGEWIFPDIGGVEWID